MSKTPAQKLTNWQNHFIKQNMPEGLTDAAQRLFNTAVSKITVIFPPEGGSRVSYEKLSEDEAFAIGVTGTPSWSVGIPKSVREKVQAVSPRGKLGEFEVIAPLDKAAKYRLLDLERKNVLVTQHGQKFATKRPKGSQSKRNKFIHKLAIDNPKPSGLDLYLSVVGRKPCRSTHGTSQGKTA